MNHSNNIKKIFDIFPSARLVGGCVRDSLLGIEPKDYDFSTKYLPKEIMDICASHNIETVPTGLHHGTVSIILDGVAYEITSTRKDVDTDGRHAIVEFKADWEEDASRRDFTFNALYEDRNGKIYDYFGGIRDLKNKEVKFIGSASDRIKEDYLRILRYFRFSSRFNCDNFNEDAINSINELQHNITKLSIERVNSELSKICSLRNQWTYLNKMNDIGIIKTIFGKDVAFKDYYDKNITDYLVTYSIIEKETKSLVKTFRLSQQEQKFISIILDEIYVMFYQNELDIQKLLQKYTREELVKKTIYSNLYTTGNITQVLDTINMVNIPKFDIGGKDLIELGLKPGPEFSSILNDLKKKWIDSGFLLTKKELLKLMK